MAILLEMHYYKGRGAEDLKEITEDNYPGFISLPLAVMVFSSPWCSSCKKVAASLDAIAPELEGKVSFGTCDISAHPTVASSLQVLSLPTLMVFKNGVEVKKIMGPVADAAMLRMLKELL
jgi:thioredoxin 1